MQVQQQRVEDSVVAGGASDQVDLGQFVRCKGPSGARQPSWLADPVRGAVCGLDESVGDGPVVERSRGGDEQFAGVAAAAAVAAGLGAVGEVLPHRLQVAGGDAVDRLVSPGSGHALPVAAVGA
ncbi:hypothetical protein ACPPVO_22870 [Dactylosporangium sp. McL0621]|uniref:hypothetical protein n=1 Tax=Dactylosporangium sp. McL0621 TaxID=3415678 RepID=UPI003CE79549